MFKLDFDMSDLLKLGKAMQVFPKEVMRSAQNSTKEMAEEIRTTWREKSDRSDMPGIEFSPEWKARKAKLGFHTEDLQRFGRGDARSYYENLEIFEYQPFGGVFVGLLQGTTGYTDSGKVAAWTLDRIAEAQEKYHPIWKEMLDLALDKLPGKIEQNFLRDMNRIGLGNNGNNGST